MGSDDLTQTPPSSGPLMHRLALEAMGITAQLVATTLGLPLCTSNTLVPLPLSSTSASSGHRTAINSLPHSWETTSDSLAATVATTKNSGLLLVKSSPPKTDSLQRGWHLHGWVDQHFPTWPAPA